MFFTDVVAAAGDAVITTDSTGHITSWNPEAQALLGFLPEQAIGQTLALIVPEPYRPRHVAGFHRGHCLWPRAALSCWREVMPSFGKTW